MIINYKIQQYTTSYKEKLKEYLQKVFPQYSNSYINYCIQNAKGKDLEQQDSLIVLDEKDNIRGCHLYYNTKAKIHGKITSVCWGHDTHLDANYRHKTTFPRKISEIDAFGIGLSKINKEIQKHYGILFFEGLFNYAKININFFYALILRLLKTKELEFLSLKEIEVGNNTFQKIENVDDLNITNNGYWNEGVIDVDFVRDSDFFKNRFFENNVYKYSIYQIKHENNSYSPYFVVRPIVFKGFHALFLVDFRYDLSKPNQLRTILKAVNKLAKRNNFGIVFLTSNDKNILKTYNRFSCLKSPLDFYAKGRFKKLVNANTFITAADSDVDFIR